MFRLSSFRPKLKYPVAETERYFENSYNRKGNKILIFTVFEQQWLSSLFGHRRFVS
jgi:hypothetical protein